MKEHFIYCLIISFSFSLQLFAQNFNFKTDKIVELPRPNSGTYTFEEAGKRKDEIYKIKLTKKYKTWKNPYSGGSVHINAKDEVEVYNCHIFFQKPKTFSQKINPDKVLDFVSGFTSGNPSGVLITSEIDLKKSKSFKILMKKLFIPSVQIFYISKQ